MNIYNIDLHYHCGLERQEGTSIEDYLNHAYMTGRKVIGMTDHIQAYIGCDKEENRRYAIGAEGVLEYYQDVMQYQKQYSQLQILFAPEISLDFDFHKLPQDLIDVCDYFICEPPIADGDHTIRILNRMKEMSKFGRHTNKPLFLAHPLRHAINQRIVKCKQVEPWVIELAYHEDWQKYSLKQVSDYFWVDIEALCDASIRLDIPIEVNGGTLARIMNTNLMSSVQIYTAAYGYIKGMGAQLVCGSDQHAITSNGMRVGRYMPQQIFNAIGATVEDMQFLKKIQVI